MKYVITLFDFLFYLLGRLFLIVIIISFTSNAFAQCIDRKKVEWSGDRLFYDYSYLIPGYDFAYGGDTSKKWNINNNNIDIRQAPPNALKFKTKVERLIKNYAGNNFFKNLKFYNVTVAYPDRLKLFIDSGAQVSLKHYKAKYFYNYGFEPDTTTGYLIGIGVNSYGKVISPFVFPSKRHYKPINKNFTYCRLIEIARKAQNNIDPIDRIEFDYDKQKKKFYWLISQAIINDHEGTNYINQVIIDAADFNNVKTVRSSVIVEY